MCLSEGGLCGNEVPLFEGSGIPLFGGVSLCHYAHAELREEYSGCPGSCGILKVSPVSLPRRSQTHPLQK